MAVELIVTELFKRGNERFPKGSVIRDAETMDWAQATYPTHVMRKFYQAVEQPAPVSAPVDEPVDGPKRSTK